MTLFDVWNSTAGILCKHFPGEAFQTRPSLDKEAVLFAPAHSFWLHAPRSLCTAVAAAPAFTFRWQPGGCLKAFRWIWIQQKRHVEACGRNRRKLLLAAGSDYTMFLSCTFGQYGRLRDHSGINSCCDLAERAETIRARHQPVIFCKYMGDWGEETNCALWLLCLVI